MTRVLVVCTGNKARSQMAEGWLRHFGEGRVEAHSAGTHPSGVWPLVVKAMAEAGVDVSAQWSKHVGEFEGQEFDYVVTVCDDADRACPAFPGAKTRLHVPFRDPWLPAPDPRREAELVREVRDQIRDWAREFCQGLEG